MTFSRIGKSFGLALAVATVLPQLAWAHFIWLRAEPAKEVGGKAEIQAFFNEQPEPDADFVKYTQKLALKVNGQTIASTQGEESRNASWVGHLPGAADTEHDLGVMTKGKKPYRLVYTARAQTGAASAKSKEAEDKLRARVIEVDDKNLVEVLFDGKPVAKARIKVYAANGETSETTAGDDGRAEIAGLGKETAGLWANHVDEKAGEKDGKAYEETRYYATLTFTPGPDYSETATAEQLAPVTHFATMPDPAVNSFGGAVLGDWLYVYSGHIGRTHRYNVETTAKHFRRLNLKDRKTWEDLPMDKDLQGVALVSDGKALYRTGGMSALNPKDEDEDLKSVADFAKYDPETKTWTQLAPMPEPRSTHDSVVIGRTVYVVGGWTMKGSSEESDFLDSALAFDLDHPEAGWKKIKQPFKRRALSVGEQGGKLYVLGGLVGGGMTVQKAVDVYDPSAGTWSKGPELPGRGRFEGFGTSAIAVNGRLYYSGGSGVIYRLSKDGDVWETVGAWALPRITHRILPGPGGSLLAVGGSAKGDQTPVIESIPLQEGLATAAAGE